MESNKVTFHAGNLLKIMTCFVSALVHNSHVPATMGNGVKQDPHDRNITPPPPSMDFDC